MKIYTKTGDKGTTSLLGGTRVPKYDPRIEAYGTVDELNSFLGLLADQVSDASMNDELRGIQTLLFTIGSRLAAEPGESKFPLPEIKEEDISALESAMDRMDDQLTPLRNFILPGGHPCVSQAHICRTVCRRAERRVAELTSENEGYSILMRYLNRLSDYFFVLSRYLMKINQVSEIPWKPRQ
ncbi:MAG: cob(I)yrinic acid a,c-diamide adenosyltransferase, partial [Bacteroidota bacterium]|nr:cob(I)yrinic acid a,c-diamide adenosyltransferase [Bacteroidota bacterium]